MRGDVTSSIRPRGPAEKRVTEPSDRPCRLGAKLAVLLSLAVLLLFALLVGTARGIA